MDDWLIPDLKSTMSIDVDGAGNLGFLTVFLSIQVIKCINTLLTDRSIYRGPHDPGYIFDNVFNKYINYKYEKYNEIDQARLNTFYERYSNCCFDGYAVIKNNGQILKENLKQHMVLKKGSAGKETLYIYANQLCEDALNTYNYFINDFYE